LTKARKCAKIFSLNQGLKRFALFCALLRFFPNITFLTKMVKNQSKHSHFLLFREAVIIGLLKIKISKIGQNLPRWPISDQKITEKRRKTTMRVLCAHHTF
jgi:hypothetical protein